jgi:catechol 2,3-dioxygenase-like lactoylglutathione lyase family enzyme
MSDRAVDHFDLVVSDFERSESFYLGLLEPLGWRKTGVIEGERGEHVQYHGSGETSFSLRRAQSDAHPTPYDRYAVGIHHVAFGAPTREAVDERAAWLREQGAEIESGPAEYPQYTDGYYAVFFYDPDGIKLELCFKPRS